MLGTYLAVALTHALRRARPGRPWQHTLFLLGADRLRGDTLDRLCDACEASRTGLVLAYRSIPPHVRARLGRGNAAVAFMRLGNAEDARAASEQLGTEHRLVLSQLTETVGVSVTDTTAGSYTSTTGSTSSLAMSRSVTEGTARTAGQGRAEAGGVLPSRAGRSRNAQTSDSRSTGDSQSVSAGISASTAWGITTSRAAGDSDSLAVALQRSREFLVEQHELQQLPPSAMIVTYAGPEGRQVVLADANPGIGGLSAATMATLDEFGRQQAAGSAAGPDARAAPQATGSAAGPDARPAPEPAGTGAVRAVPQRWRSGENRPPPNLGPPPPRLDWRKRRS
jgi:hypothetical protein